MKLLTVALLLFAPAAFAQTFSGVLENGDAVRDGGAYYDAYTFRAAENQRVTVRMTGVGFDTYLIVIPPAGGEPYTNDDFEGVSVSQVDFIAREGGMFTIQAAGYSSGLTGPYDVDVTLGGIADVETIEGRLIPGDEQALKGEYFDEHAIPGGRDGQVAFEVISYGFDGFLVVESPSGQVYRNDDAEGYSYSGGPRIARVGPLENEPGTWTVAVTSLSLEEMGAYDLRIIRND